MVIATESTLPTLSEPRVKISGQGPSKSVNWLIIAHEDDRVLNSLSGLIGEEQAAILTAPASGWHRGDPELAEAVQWSVREAHVEHLLVVGHSEASMFDQGECSMGPQNQEDGSSNASSTGYNRLLQGAKQVQNKIQRGKKAFAKQVLGICEMPDVQTGIIDRKLKLHALYYVAESGTFLLLDVANETFEPLG